MSRSSPFATRRIRRGAGLVGLLVTLALLLATVFQPASPSAFAATEYANNDGITFSGTGSAGPATPYPSKVTVAGLAGTITEVTVSLVGLTHSFPDAIDILLVGPNGGQVLLMADAGGFNAISAVNLTFKDGALALPDSTTIESGTYRPTNWPGVDVFPPAQAPNPSPPALSSPPNLLLASAFNQADPNGDWHLYIVEDSPGGTGSIISWSLSIATVDLAVEVGVAPATIIAGTPLEYSLTVSNNGTEAVANPALSIPVPANTTFNQLTVPGTWSCTTPAVGASGTISCTHASFVSGAADTFSVNVQVDKALLPGSILTRTAMVSSSVIEGKTVTANNSASQTTAVTTLANLAIASVTSDTNVNAGANFTAIFKVVNNGPSNAAKAQVTLPVPVNTTFVSITPPDGWTCTAPAVGATGSSVCSTEVFVANTGEVAFTTVVKVNTDRTDAEVITSSASISADTNDPSSDNNSGTDNTTVATLTDLGVTAVASPDPVSSASNLTYTIEVVNNGPSNAASARMTTAVIPGTTFVSLAKPNDWTCTTPEVNNLGPIECTHPSFNVTSATFTLVVQVLSGVGEGEQLLSAAEVATITTDNKPDNNRAEAAATVTVEADIVVKISGAPTVAKPGSELTYQLKVTNAGPEFAEGIELTSAVPASTTFASLTAPAGWICTTPAAGATGNITCQRAALEPGDETLSLTVLVGSQTALGTNIQLNAAVTVSSPEDPRPNNNSASQSTLIDVQVNMGVTISGPTTPWRPGDTNAYTIGVTNSGPDAATTAGLITAVPANTTFVSLTAPAGWTCTTPEAGATGAINCTNPSFAVGAPASFTLTVQADSINTNMTVTLNATVSSALTDLQPRNNNATLTTELSAKGFIYLPLVVR